VRRGIAAATAVLYIGSPDAAQSQNVRSEVLIAKEENRKVIPLWARGNLWSTSAPFEIMPANFLDARGDAYSAAFARLRSELNLPTSASDSGSDSEPRVVDKPAATQPVASPPVFGSIVDSKPSQAFTTPTPAPARPGTMFQLPLLTNYLPERLASLGFTLNVVDGVEFILPPVAAVPLGPFLMGSSPERDKSAQKDEQPQHWVTVPDFSIARFPVTVAEYACFVRMGHREPRNPNDELDDRYGRSTDGSKHVTWTTQVEQRIDHPVTEVAYHDANAYAAWLSKLTGMHWRLPSETEWEKAARWDSVTGHAYTYPWGDSFEEGRCNYTQGGVGSTTPIGMYAGGVSPYGIFDMAGNTTEWTTSDYLEYPYEPDGNRKAPWPPTKVMRGGYRAAARREVFSESNPQDLEDVGGFRLVLAHLGAP
jgi:formylglycine-generating enzyme required for sulfatase activity